MGDGRIERMDGPVAVAYVAVVREPPGGSLHWIFRMRAYTLMMQITKEAE
jgi:hypothetical protein